MYRVTIEQGPHAGEVGVGTTLAAAIEGLLARCPDLVDGVWWSWTDSNSPGVTCGARSFTFAVGRPVDEPDTLTCTYCHRTLSGPGAEDVYRLEHRGGGCLDGEDYIAEVLEREGGSSFGKARK
jgi:hypothetical protein